MAERNRRTLGTEKERLAADWMKRHGYEILEMNYRCRQGEVDIVAKDGAYLVFAEVKYRRDAGAGYPAEAVDGRKQRRISYAARHYMMRHSVGEDMPVRFDVIAILGDQITAIANAFGISG